MPVMELTKLQCYRNQIPDDVFVCCANGEGRCLGSLQKFDGYKFNQAFLFFYDKRDSKSHDNINSMRTILSKIGPTREIATSDEDPITGIAKFCSLLKELNITPAASIITVDITALSTKHILLLLRTVDSLGFWGSIRLVYSEPKDYVADLYLPMSSGIRRIDVVPGFVNNQCLSKSLLLLIFLGYEGDRANALVQNIDPNETLLAIPRPAFHPEWEKRTEEMNSNLIQLIGDDHKIEMHSLDCNEVAVTLSKILVYGPGSPLAHKNCCIVPLGTKPQTVGLYLFWRQNVGKFEIQHASPLEVNEQFVSRGIGKTWLLVNPDKS